jgi:hypothetical protein
MWDSAVVAMLQALQGSRCCSKALGFQQQLMTSASCMASQQSYFMVPAALPCRLPLREEVAAMVVHNVAARGHDIFKGIAHLVFI